MQIIAVFLVLSIVFWTLSKLSKQYTHIISFNTNYINLTKEKALQKSVVPTIDIQLKTNGFKLLSYNLKKPKIDIDLLQLNKLKNHYYYLTNSNITSLQKQLSSEETIMRIDPDTLFFDFGMLMSKKIKVNPILKLDYTIGYDAVSTQISPDSIVVTGPKKQIDLIESINTKPLEMSHISIDIRKVLQLDIPKNMDKVNYSINEVLFKAKIDKFSEGSLKTFFELVNVPSDVKITTFSKEVKLTYRVSLDNYDKIKASDFKVICDYLKTKNNNLKYLIPIVSKKSDLVSDIKITPNRLEFLYKND